MRPRSTENGVVAECLLRPIEGGTEAASAFRSDGGGELVSADEVHDRLRGGDAVWALRETAGERLPPDRPLIRETQRVEVLQAYVIAGDVETHTLQRLAEP